MSTVNDFSFIKYIIFFGYQMIRRTSCAPVIRIYITFVVPLRALNSKNLRGAATPYASPRYLKVTDPCRFNLTYSKLELSNSHTSSYFLVLLWTKSFTRNANSIANLYLTR